MNGESVLRMMCRFIGDQSLRKLCAADVDSFLNRPRISPMTRRGNFSLVRNFLRFLSARGLIAMPVLAEPPRAFTTFVPYVYSQLQIQTLLAAAGRIQKASRLVDGATLRALIMTLYATGAVINEVLRLTLVDVDLRRRRVELQGDQRTRKRCIPICPDLRRELDRFIRRTRRGVSGDRLLFQKVSGGAIGRSLLDQTFQRLLKEAQIDRSDTLPRSPRLQDFRATFAVHRLTEWMRQGSEISALIPSLSAYMGYTGLAAADKYLGLVSQRFKKDLNKLSPTTNTE